MYYRNQIFVYRNYGIFYQNYISSSPLGHWNIEYRPFFIQITKIQSKKLANTKYHHIIRHPPYV